MFYSKHPVLHVLSYSTHVVGLLSQVLTLQVTPTP